MPSGRWSKERFEEHHREHPEIYKMFCRFALRAAEVREYYSAKIIFHRIRWETQIEEKNSEFKIDDGWISHYARKFMDDYITCDEFFQTRVRADGYFTEDVEDE